MINWNVRITVLLFLHRFLRYKESLNQEQDFWNSTKLLVGGCLFNYKCYKAHHRWTLWVTVSVIPYLPCIKPAFCSTALRTSLITAKDSAKCSFWTLTHNQALKIHLSEISTRYDRWRLVVDTDFETSWTPINKLYAAFSFDSCNCSINIFRHDITTKQ